MLSFFFFFQSSSLEEFIIVPNPALGFGFLKGRGTAAGAAATGGFVAPFFPSSSSETSRW
jgi:hypothetical protein